MRLDHLFFLACSGTLGFGESNLRHRKHTRLGVFSRSNFFSDGNVGGATPVPIPNTEVKPSSADDTAWVTVWESRSSPDVFTQSPRFPERGLFLYTDRHGLTQISEHGFTRIKKGSFCQL